MLIFRAVFKFIYESGLESFANLDMPEIFGESAILTVTTQRH